MRFRSGLATGLTFACLLVASATGARAADAAPAWLLAVTRQPSTTEVADSTSLVLLDENIVTIGTNGRRVTRQRQVIRILKREGREAAIARIHFAAKADKISDFRAWLIPAEGETRSFGRKDVVEIATAPEALYADTRAAVINAAAEADAGGVFGWEGTLDERSTLGQGFQWLQTTTPVAVARVIVRVPKDWRLDGRVRGLASIAPQVEGDSYAWELRDLPAFSEEPYGPGATSAAINLVYDIRPPRSASGMRTFDSWADVVTYAGELHDRPAQPDPSIEARARELCSEAATPWDKIRVLSTYAQKLRYISIAMNLGTGGGFRPNPATDVLRCGYGDCKDKTTLLRALLASQGVKAWPVLCFSGDPTAASDGWPSPLQFNHVFTAIELGDMAVPDATFVVEHPGIGRVLLFDPTDPHCRIGDFPAYNQGASVLICSPGTTELSPVPIAPPEKNHLRRRAKVAIEPGGGARLGVFEAFTGAAAAEIRDAYEHESKLNEAFERQLQGVHPGAVLNRVELKGLDTEDRITLRTGFGAPRYSRPIRDQLLVFMPIVRLKESSGPLPAGPRKHPILLPSMSLDESTEFLLPDGYRVSELGAPLVLEREFGRYELSLTQGEKNIIVRRVSTMHGGVHPAARYEEIRSFVESARKAEATPIVLERVATP